MTAKERKDDNVVSSDNKKGSEKTKNPPELRLVFWMLFSLTLLVVLLIVLPFFARNEANNIDFIEYSKWILPALLGAFGAWIGAGAAYYFGKENLKLSNSSTQDALEIQGETSKHHADKATIYEMNPTTLNPEFEFTMDSTLKDVEKELNKNVDYWFIPVLEKNKMKDVIHIEALWRFSKDGNKSENKNISDLINYIKRNPDTIDKLSKLHGFFKEFKMDDRVSDSFKLMEKYNAIVGIVCDDRGYATHCFVRRDLKVFMYGSS